MCVLHRFFFVEHTHKEMEEIAALAGPYIPPTPPPTPPTAEAPTESGGPAAAPDPSKGKATDAPSQAADGGEAVLPPQGNGKAAKVPSQKRAAADAQAKQEKDDNDPSKDADAAATDKKAALKELGYPSPRRLQGQVFGFD